MISILRRFTRILGVTAVLATIVGLIRSVRPRPKPTTSGVASWPPLVDPPPPAARTGPVEFTAAAEAAAAESWVEAIDGECPDSYPIKGNAQSGIFHIPGGQSYERTRPQRCYPTAAEAEADGLRQARR